MTVERVACGHTDQFPVGMRVLAVDDDPTCLRLLETLLRRCQYNVTTANQAITALHLLRDNKNKFDLVISDVHMPDMDGFKLLELVGLEMDLPVIMLSANGDTKLVMKGITHGACDYLLKPIRIEELKNIWQHVVRRKKVDVKDHNNYDGQEKAHFGDCQIAESGNSDQSGKLNKKRKDNEDLCEEHDEDENENEDPSAQKKPRVVWSVELHGKFVAAVRQLGIDKAVPKRILELMNVDKLTRENVASHLQKYRLYLKRLSSVVNQQTHMPVPFSSTDSTYIRMAYINGFGNLPSLAASNQLPGGAYRPFSSSATFGRLNTPAGVGLHGLPASGMSHATNLEDLSDVSSEQSNFHPVVISEDFRGGILQGMPMSSPPNELHHKGVTSTGGLPTVVDNVGVSPVSGSFIGARSVTRHSGNPVRGVPSYPVLLEGHVHEVNDGKLSGDQLSVPGASNKELSSHMPDLRRCSDNWPSAVPSELQSNTFPSNDHCLRQASSRPNDLRDSLSVIAAQNGSSFAGFPSLAPLPNALDSRADLRCQALATSCHNSGQMIKDPSQELGAPYSSYPFNGAMIPLGRDMEQTDMFCSSDTDLDSITQANFVDPVFMKCNEVAGSTMEMSMGAHQKRHGSYSLNTDSLEDLTRALVKQEQKFPEGRPGGSPCSFWMGI